MRLIDADALINDLEHDIAIDEDILAYAGTDQITRATTQFDKDCKQNAIDLLMSAPTIDIPHGDDWEAYSERLWKNAYERGKADRPQGEWIDAEIPLECGGSMPIQVCNLCKTFYPLAYTGGGHRFCPNCGADMRKGADDESVL